MTSQTAMVSGVEVSLKAGIEELAVALDTADAVVIGAGAGLSTAAGFTYSGERFDAWFADFGRTFGFKDMYSGGFYPYDTYEQHWAFWSRYIYCNRYDLVPACVYTTLLDVVRGKDYVVLTTNVDHQFQLAGFDKRRLFYTQGDYGLFQCSQPCHAATYDNEAAVRDMLVAQGLQQASDGSFLPPAKVGWRTADGSSLRLEVPSELVPRCPKCGKPMAMNLRADGTFVEDDGWHAASLRYAEFTRRHEGLRMLYLELGVGYNTPVIIKYPFWQATAANPKATYACLNLGDLYLPREIRGQAICIDADIASVFAVL